VEAGIIPESSLQKIDWMYEGAKPQTGTSAEEYLLGKSLTEKEIQEGKEGKQGGEKGIVPVIRQSYSTPENENFVKMMEDPLVYIKQKELENKRQAAENPYMMKKIREQIEALKEGKKKHKKKEKKKKKHRTRSTSGDDRDSTSEKRNRRSRSRSDSHERRKKKSRHHHKRSSRSSS